MPLSKRAYSAWSTKHAGEGRAVRAAAVAGSRGLGAVRRHRRARARERRSRRSSPGSGFWEHFLPAMPARCAQRLAQRRRLAARAPGAGEAEQARLVGEMLELYYADAIDRWQRVERAAGPSPAGFHGRCRGSVLRPLAVPPSPLARLLQAIADETRLTVPPGSAARRRAGRRGTGSGAGPGRHGASAAADARWASRARRWASRCRRASRRSLGWCRARTAPRRRSIGPCRRPTTSIWRCRPAVRRRRPAQASQVRAQADKLAADAAPLPPAVKEPLLAWPAGSKGLAGGQVLSRINDEYRAKVMPFCRQATADRFPFALGSGVDVSLGDMARLFGAGGLFDQFAEQQLAPFVDMAKRPWQWLQPIGSSSGALAPFELARRLRDGLFAGGAVAAGRVHAEADRPRCRRGPGRARPGRPDR